MHLTVVHDGDCGFCTWCRDWLVGQQLLVPVTTRPSSDPEAVRRWGDVDGYGDELLVADDDGRVWVGPAAFAVALWATARYRTVSHHLTGPAARAMLHALSSNRDRLGRVVGAPCDDGSCARDPAGIT